MCKQRISDCVIPSLLTLWYRESIKGSWGCTGISRKSVTMRILKLYSNLYNKWNIKNQPSEVNNKRKMSTDTFKIKFLRNEMRQKNTLEMLILESERERVTLNTVEESIWKIQKFVVKVFQEFLLINKKIKTHRRKST